MKFIFLCKCFECLRGELSSVVCNEGMGNSVASKVSFGHLYDCRGLDRGKPIQFVIVTVMVHSDQIGRPIKRKQILRNQLPG